MRIRLSLILLIIFLFGCSASAPTKMSRLEENKWEVLGVEEIPEVGRIIVEYKIGDNDPFLMTLLDGKVKNGTYRFRVINQSPFINHVKISFKGKCYSPYVKTGWTEMYPFEIHNLGYFEPEGHLFWLIDAHVKITEILVKTDKGKNNE